MRTTVLAVTTALVLTGCAALPEPASTPSSPATVTPTSDPSAPASEPPTVDDAPPFDVATGLDAPWSIAFVGDDLADGVLVSGRDDGVIRELDAAGGLRDVLTVSGVRHGSEGGLLGLAVDAAASALFVYATTDDGNRVQRYPITGSAGSLSLGEPTTVIDGIPAASTHNGGRIAIGPDGMLYIATGDAGDRGAAQDTDSLAGKILRLTVDGDVPPDNPTPGSAVYSLGHRNVQGLAWTADGTLYASEFGQNTFDELNRIEPGANYGWPEVEGEGGGGAAEFTDPIATWATDDASPSGIAIVGDVVYIANLQGRTLRSLELTDPSAQSTAGDWGRLRDVVVAPDGRLWVLTNNTDGRGEPSDGDDRVVSVFPASADD